MAQKVVTTVYSDVSGKQGARPRRFAVGEQVFEKDFLDSEWEEFKEAITAGARKVKRKPGRLSILHPPR